MTAQKVLQIDPATGDKKQLQLAQVATSGVMSDLSAPVADVAMGGFKLTGLADPASAQDAATKAYVDSSGGSPAPGVSVKAYGCKCDGVTDDSADFQTALNSGVAHLIVEDTMAIGSTITIPSNIRLTILPNAEVKWIGSAGPVFQTDPDNCCHDMQFDCQGVVDITGATVGIYLHTHKQCVIGWVSQASADSSLVVFKSVADSTGAGAIWRGNRNTADNIYTRVFHYGQIGSLMYFAGCDADSPTSGDAVSVNTINSFGKIRTLGNNADSSAGINNVGIEFGPHTDTQTFYDMVSLDLLSGATGIKVDDNANGDTYEIYFYGEVNVSFYGSVATNRTGVYVGSNSRWVILTNFGVDGSTAQNAEINAGAIIIDPTAISYDITFSSEGGAYANKIYRKTSDLILNLGATTSGYGQMDVLNLDQSCVNLTDYTQVSGLYGQRYYGFASLVYGHDNPSGGEYVTGTYYAHGASGGFMTTNIRYFGPFSGGWQQMDPGSPSLAFLQHIGNDRWEWRHTPVESSTQTTVAYLDGSGNLTLIGGITASNLAAVATSGAYSDLIGAPTSLTAGLIYASGATTSVVNTTTQTSIVSFTVPAGALTANGAIRIRMLGRYKNNSGSSSTIGMVLSYGGTVLWSGSTGSMATGAGVHAVDVNVVLAGSNSTSAQIIAGDISMSTNTAPTTGQGSPATIPAATTGANSAIRGQSTVNSAAAQTFSFQIKHSVANANTEFDIDFVSAVVEGSTGPAGPAGPPGGSAIAANVQSGSSYTIASTDVGCEVQMSGSSASTVYVDPSVAAAGSYVLVRQTGTGQITVAPASGGVTLTGGGPTLKTAQQGSLMYVRFDSSTLAYVGGEVASI